MSSVLYVRRVLSLEKSNDKTEDSDNTEVDNKCAQAYSRTLHFFFA